MKTVLITSVIGVLVFLPVFFLEGLAGSFFRTLALAYVLAISASPLWRRSRQVPESSASRSTVNRNTVHA
jgi:hypothetical protein